MSLTESCKANHVEPWSHLLDVFQQIPLQKSTESEIPPVAFDTLLSNVWLAQDPQHR